MNTTKNFAAMTAQAARLSLPRRFETDLTEHDAKVVSDESEYLWTLYASGTHLARLEPASELTYLEHRKYVECIRSITEPGYCIGGEIHVFHVRAGVATEITRDRAIELAEGESDAA